MKNKQFKESSAKYGNSISFLEKFGIKIAGRSDGKQNFPRECEGQWISPFIDREVHLYGEYTAGVWKKFQNEQKPYYIRLADLIDRLAFEEFRLSELKEALREEGLGECTREGTPLHWKISVLQNSIEEKRGEVSEIRNRILECDQSARITCLRYWKYLEQRLAIYWRAVLKTHPNNSSMPAILYLQIPDVQVDYKKRHEALLQRAEELYKKQEVQ